jgi:hypothetical protein
MVINGESGVVLLRRLHAPVAFTEEVRNAC